MWYLIFWGVVIAATVAAELFTQQLICIWFAVGALGAFVAALFHLGFVGQLAIFVLGSVALLLVTRPILRRLRVKDAGELDTQRETGQRAVIIEEVNPQTGTGRARLGDVDWIAVSETGCVLTEGTQVTVSRVEGAKLIVKPSV